MTEKEKKYRTNYVLSWKGQKVDVACSLCRSTYKVRKDTADPLWRARTGAGPFKCSACRSKNRSGPKNGNWKGGLTTEASQFYNSPEWKELRTKVFERDNYNCQDCGKHGGYLEANHIKPRSKYSDLKLVASNIETLCKPCHDKKKWQVYI